MAGPPVQVTTTAVVAEVAVVEMARVRATMARARTSQRRGAASGRVGTRGSLTTQSSLSRLCWSRYASAHESYIAYATCRASQSQLNAVLCWCENKLPAQQLLACSTAAGSRSDQEG
jgi:hypothetical protein